VAKTAAELWLLELERERHDMSWKNGKPAERYAPPQPIIVKQRVVAADPEAQKKRDRIMYHAGRFAQGARDQEAIDANLQVGKIIQKGNK
jgi:hypothetical protein